MTTRRTAPAKINLWLRVGPPGADGFHPIDTLFCALELGDTVELGPGGAGRAPLAVDFDHPLTSAPELGDPADNLAVRAARAFVERAGLPDREAPTIRLIKRIPAGGGLGGGSSDAAAVLRALADRHPGALDDDSLHRLAGELGSDVAFFLQDAPLARGAGRGERLTPISSLPARPVVLVLPGFAVPTPHAYRWLDADRGGLDRALEPAPDAPRSWHDVAARAVNDLEDPVFTRHPVLRTLRDELRGAGASIALMAGSGSTVFGVFEDRETADAAIHGLRADGGPTVVGTATLGSEPNGTDVDRPSRGDQ